KFSAGIKAMMADQEFQDNINKIGVQINYCEDIESKNRWLSDSRKLSKTLQETGILDSIKAEKQ
ncbi:MAG: tripartite tricarboxylate transporter substrate binding protein, partial [Smithella sp.]